VVQVPDPDRVVGAARDERPRGQDGFLESI
jgi:hypothetical protein